MVTVIGTPRRRIEGAEKVTGATRFTADFQLRGLAHARLVLSPHPSARILRVDLAAARAAPGVLDAVSGAELPAVAASGPDQPLARERVHFAGQPVAAVVAETEEAAADAAALVEVDYEPLEAVLDPGQATRPDVSRVLDDACSGAEDTGAHGVAGGGEDVDGELPPNVSARVRFREGDVDAALAASALVVGGRYRVPAVHQGFLEPHVAIAEAGRDGSLTIWTPTQGSFSTRSTVAEQLRLPVSRVRVVPMPVGGGFGGKLCLVEPLLALLSSRVERPVRLELTRTEEFLMGRGAPGATIDLALGADGNGGLLALRADVVFDNGAGPGGLGGLAALLLGGAYRLPAYDITALDVVTNKTPVTAYRAPGGAHAFFALESAMDELASRLGQDPIELRLRNASREGDPRPDGRRWPRIGLIECLEAAREHPVYTGARADGEGVGLAVGAWGGGLEPAAAGCRVEPDGTLLLHLGSVDISGTNTTLAMIAAETFGVSPDRVRIETGDTATAPYAGMAGGSKTIYTVGPAVQQAAADARRQVLEIAAEELEAALEDLIVEDGEVRVAGTPGHSLDVGHLAGLAAQFGGRYPPVLGQGRAAVAAQSPMFTVQVARTAVDAETGQWRLTGYAAIQDVGRALNPPEVEGQIHGGALQSLGRVLGEELVWDGDGQLRTASFVDYGLPTIDQAPDIEVELLELPSPHGPFGAKGVGEPPAVPAPAAVANAIHAACGRRLTTLPADFLRLFEAAGLPVEATT
ncbi:MAG: xanthine dehydrogenase family protein [Candidatus Dormibacteraeota bacterium]|uniref:Xanthine dehydrogenase family protein n=1 Tax=Candidatus Nephthysia bennettiae TaxID=3127016 RepID=A0A934KAU0_9BACT|nr:xanthine dehydrogenase family protein [Candidatus Dormibacteraeota bacterium]MBJ7612664.1 xanthine dehydrogenase family protein [Candidatus Dormibacteraeota bacterium]